ncbi:hypothetical protein GQ457_04G032420 [Hibiscus cannabinus]
MAKIYFSHLLFFLFIFYLNIGSVESSMTRPRHTSKPGVKTFIKVSCQTTCYLALYIKYLARYANSNTQNKQQLTQSALTISLYKARYTRLYMSKVAKELDSIKDKDYPVVRDCLQQIDDIVSHLSQSIRELRRCNPKAVITDDVFWHIDNVDTWISAALTDASSCAEQKVTCWELCLSLFLSPGLVFLSEKILPCSSGYIFGQVEGDYVYWIYPGEGL